jgi:oxalate decarboxylase/phosphoglucose isomerase-like protein (cupin superfamily)
MGACEGSGPARDELEVFRDERGALTLAELDRLPFIPARAYVLHAIPAGASRAGHAHRSQHRWLAVISGSVEFIEDDGRRAATFELGEGRSRHVPPGVWYELRALQADPVILVFASGAHDPSDYVRERSAMPLQLVTTVEQTS